MYSSVIRRFSFITSLVIIAITGLQAQSNIRFENYTLEDGLPHNIISCSYQDQLGWIWIGSNRGLCRFDGISFKTYFLSHSDPETESSHVTCFYEDRHSRFWMGTEDAGLVLYDREFDDFTYFSYSDTCGNCINSNLVYSITADSSGIMWLGTDKGVNRYDPETNVFQSIRNVDSLPVSISGNIVLKVFTDSRQTLWIGSTTGLDYREPKTGEITHLDLRSEDNEIIDVWDITENSKGQILVGTYHTGLITIDPLTKKVINRFIPDPDYRRSYVVRSIVELRSGDYWLGTRGGIYVLDKEMNTLAHHVHRENDPSSLSHISVNHIFEDQIGDIWVSSRNGISHVNQEKQRFNYYGSDLRSKKFLNNSEIYCILESNDGKIWIGTEAGGVNILDHSSGQFSYLMHDEKNSNSLSSNCIKCIIQDRHGNYWIGTFLGGLNHYDVKKNRISHYLHDPDNPNSILDNRVWAVHEDRKGNIWLGTSSGLDRFDPESKTFYHYRDSIQNDYVSTIYEDRAGNLYFGDGLTGLSILTPEGEIIFHDISSRVIYEDSKGRIWIGSDEYFGLHEFDLRSGIKKTYTNKDNIPSNQIFGILEDNSENLWLSTGHGLSMFDPALGKSLKNYRKEDGIQGNRFYYGAYCKTKNGNLFFGGQNGLSSFDPERLIENRHIPPVYITGIKILNKEVPIGKEFLGKTILEKSISESEEIILDHAHSVLTLDFVALNYINSSKNTYAYYLEGFEEEWNYVDATRSATYTNLNPGKYTFRVKAANNDGIWNEEGVSLGVIIKPPIWRTIGFKFFIIAFISGIIYLIISFFVKRELLKNQLVLERVKSKELHKIDMMKFQFFTNISHEIRTPISLIVSPLTRIKNSNLSINQIKNDLDVVYRNAIRLGKLVDQLLDFRKIEAGKLKLDLSRGDIVSFLRNVLSMFKELSQEKNVKLEFYSVLEQIQLYFDPDKIEKVLFNLLSNSFKHTPEGGVISVAVSLTYHMSNDDAEEKSFTSGEYVQIVVKDTGRGIPDSKKDKIFNRFYQGKSGETTQNTGSGIGLSLSKELIKIQNGRISLESKEGAGTVLTLLIPAIKENPVKQKADAPAKIESTEADIVQQENYPEQEKLLDCATPLILVLEDNKELLSFIKSIFNEEYNVITAEDGESGLELAYASIPDIIISDIMMPKMDGKKFGKTVKQDFRTSHIPLVFLTALSSKQHEKEGILLGADEYISKPFDPQILKVRVDQLLATRRLLREKYSRDNILQNDELEIGSKDDKFLQKLVEIIEENIDDPEFGTVRISREVGVSRTQLYRKMAALTDMTVKEFIRSIRLKRAARMILKEKHNISEVAYNVGFQQVAYFRKCFKEMFGMTPTDYIKKNSIDFPYNEQKRGEIMNPGKS